jgi:KDO2-lipid IV(A) lauroyltransferase
MARDVSGTALDWIIDRLIRLMISRAMARPYEERVAYLGRAMARILSPLAFRRRILANLALARPDLSASDSRRIAAEVADNFGRTVAEIYSGPAFTDRIAAADPLTGPGLPVLLEAQAKGHPVILAVAHFGNYDAMRAALVARGLTVGAVYRPQDNPYFNAHYTKAIHRIAEPLFPRTRAGSLAMIRFVRDGGMVALGFDQHTVGGARLTFFGQPALTVLTPAELALKYDAPLLPIHAIRQPDGLSFKVLVDAPIPPSDPETMMQAANDRLEQVVRAHMGQWFWVHRRWKAAQST